MIAGWQLAVGRWPKTLLLFVLNLIAFTILRLIFFAAFRPHPLPRADLLHALYLGLKFDARLAAIVALPLLFFASTAYVIAAEALLAILYAADFGTYAYVHERLNATMMRIATLEGSNDELRGARDAAMQRCDDLLVRVGVLEDEMKAAICTGYGPPEVLQIRDVPDPMPRKNEVCIRLFATAVTARSTASRWAFISVADRLCRYTRCRGSAFNS